MSVRVAVLLLGCALLTGCAHNPATGRTDFVMMSEQQEIELGRNYAQEIAKQYPRYADEKLQAYVQRVGERVAQVEVVADPSDPQAALATISYRLVSTSQQATMNFTVPVAS